MHIKCFATLRNVLRRAEATSKEDQLTNENFDAWRRDLKQAVEACFANPIPAALPGKEVANDALATARNNVRRSTKALDATLDRKVRSAIVEEFTRPAMVLLKSDAKNAEAKALDGLRTCAEAAAVGLIRIFADPSDDYAATQGAAGKLRVLAHALQSRNARAVMARLGEVVDPTHHLQLELGDYQAATRVMSHEGSSRFQQAFDQNRPVPVKALVVTFDGEVAGPPPIQTVFVNEQLVDAYWKWEEAAAAAAPNAASTEGDAAAAAAASAEQAARPAATGPVKQTIMFAKAQPAVRSWSVVVSSDRILAVEAEIDVQPNILVPRIHCLNGNTRNFAEIVTAPGGLTTSPLLRDVVTAALRHFHGPSSQDRLVFTVQHAAVDAQSTTVTVGAARGAAKSATFYHAGAKVRIEEAQELLQAATGGAKRGPGKTRHTTRRALWIYLRVVLIQAVAFATLRALLRGWRLAGALAAFWALFAAAIRNVTAARRLVLGAPIQPRTPRRSPASTRRLIALFAHAIARATTTNATAVTTGLRNALITALRARALPFGRSCAKDVEPALSRIAEALTKVTELKGDALAAMNVPKTFDAEDDEFVQRRGAIAALLYTEGGALADSLLPAALAKDIARACSRASGDGVSEAVDVLLRQLSLADAGAIAQIAGRADETGAIALPVESLQNELHGLRTLVFAVDRTGVVAPLPDAEATALASALFPIVL